jgi:hypothetical protein
MLRLALCLDGRPGSGFGNWCSLWLLRTSRLRQRLQLLQDNPINSVKIFDFLSDDALQNCLVVGFNRHQTLVENVYLAAT